MFWQISIGLFLLDSIFSRYFVYEKVLLAAKTLCSTDYGLKGIEFNRQIHWRFITSCYRFIRSRSIQLIRFFFYLFRYSFIVWRFTSLANKICLHTNSMQVLLASARDLHCLVFCNSNSIRVGFHSGSNLTFSHKICLEIQQFWYWDPSRARAVHGFDHILESLEPSLSESIDPTHGEFSQCKIHTC